MKNPVVPAGWMLEQASDYIRAAQLLRYKPNLMRVSQVNAAIGVEILLKSFLAEPDGFYGQINQTYSVNQHLIKQSANQLKKTGKLRQDAKPSGHDLLVLFHSIPDDIRKTSGLADHHDVVERYRETFTASRYEYELAASKGFDTILADRAIEMLNSVVRYAQTIGSTDPWVQAFPNIPGLHDA
ncbi:MAG TPA: hypothetical protein EYH47_22000 [Pseudomonas oleovorans]|nr:hypothetical protein [Pseudomonas oleovorans]